MCKLKNPALSVQISFNSWLHEMHGSYWSMATSNLDDNTALSRYSAWLWPKSLIHHSPLQLTCMALLLNSHFVLSVFQPQFYPPWAGLLVGDHLRQGGPSMAAILGLGDHLWQHNMPQMVRGTSCGGVPTAAWQLSHNLSWSNHYQWISANAYKYFGMLRRVFKNCQSILAKKLLYTSLVRSQLLNIWLAIMESLFNWRYSQSWKNTKEGHQIYFKWLYIWL